MTIEPGDPWYPILLATQAVIDQSKPIPPTPGPLVVMPPKESR